MAESSHVRWRRENPEAARERDRESNARRRARVKALLDAARANPCVDCGVQLPPECMDLDHVRGEKLVNLSVSTAKQVSRALIDAEIEKCDVRCPNCHRLRHYHLGDYAERANGVRP